MNEVPNQARQRFGVAGSHGDGFARGKGLAKSQTQHAGASETTAPRPPTCPDCPPRVPSTLRSSSATEDGRAGSLRLSR